MTDRFSGCTVVFDRDIRKDDAEHILKALSMVKGVCNVIPNVSETNENIIKMRVKAGIAKKLYDLVDDFYKAE